MGEEFQIEVGNVAAGIASAGGAATRRFPSVAERNVGGFDQLKDGLAARDFRLSGVGEDGIAFDFGDGQQRLEFCDDGFEQFGEYLL